MNNINTEPTASQLLIGHFLGTLPFGGLPEHCYFDKIMNLPIEALTQKLDDTLVFNKILSLDGNPFLLTPEHKLALHIMNLADRNLFSEKQLWILKFLRPLEVHSPLRGILNNLGIMRVHLIEQLCFFEKTSPELLLKEQERFDFVEEINRAIVSLETGFSYIDAYLRSGKNSVLEIITEIFKEFEKNIEIITTTVVEPKSCKSFKKMSDKIKLCFSVIKTAFSPEFQKTDLPLLLTPSNYTQQSRQVFTFLITLGKALLVFEKDLKVVKKILTLIKNQLYESLNKDRGKIVKEKRKIFDQFLKYKKDSDNHIDTMLRECESIRKLTDIKINHKHELYPFYQYHKEFLEQKPILLKCHEKIMNEFSAFGRNRDYLRRAVSYNGKDHSFSEILEKSCKKIESVHSSFMCTPLHPINVLIFNSSSYATILRMSEKSLGWGRTLEELVPKVYLSNSAGQKHSRMDGLIAYNIALIHQLNSEDKVERYGLMEQTSFILDTIETTYEFKNGVYNPKEVLLIPQENILFVLDKLMATLKELASKNEKFQNQNSALFKLITIFYLIDKCVRKGSLNARENPLIILFETIINKKEPLFQRGILPSYLKIYCDEIYYHFTHIHIHLEKLKSSLPYLKELIDKTRNPFEKLRLIELRTFQFQTIQCIQRKFKSSLRVFPKKVETIQDLKKVYEILHSCKKYHAVYLEVHSYEIVHAPEELRDQERFDKIREEWLFLGVSFSLCFNMLYKRIGSWLDQESILENYIEKKQKICTSRNVDFSAILEEIMSEEEDPEVLIESPSGIKEEVLSFNSTVIVKDSLENWLQAAIASNNLSEAHVFNLSNIYHYTIFLKELSREKFTLSESYLNAHSRIMYGMLALELALKTAISPELLLFKNEHGQTLLASHNVYELFKCFVKNNPNTFKEIELLKSQSLHDTVRGWVESTSFGRHIFYNVHSPLAQKLKKLKEHCYLLSAILNSQLTETQQQFFLEYFETDANNGLLKLQVTIQELSKQFENECDTLFQVSFQILKHALKDKVLSEPKLLKPFFPSLIFKKIEERPLYGIIKSQCSDIKLNLRSIKCSERNQLQNLENAKQLLDLLEDVFSLGLNEQVEKSLFSAKCYLSTLGSFVEHLLLYFVEKIDPEYLDQEYETKTQKRPLRYSHRIDLFIEKILESLLELKLSDEARGEAVELSHFICSYKHYPHQTNTCELNDIMKGLQDMSSMLMAVKDELRSLETVKWFTERYTKDEDKWEKGLLEDIRGLLDKKVFSFGSHLLGLLQSIQEAFSR